MTPPEPRVTCAAQVSWSFGDYGKRTPHYCRAVVGLRYLQTLDGRRVPYCAKHADIIEAQVRRGSAA